MCEDCCNEKIQCPYVRRNAEVADKQFTPSLVMKSLRYCVVHRRGKKGALVGQLINWNIDEFHKEHRSLTVQIT